MRNSPFFERFARRAAKFTGSPACFLVAVAVVILWAATGPMFGFGQTWQLVINTGTTIVTFLMVFLIQNTQNSDTEAIQLKLDELIRAIEPASNELLALEELEQKDLDAIQARFSKLAKEARQHNDVD